MADLVIKNGRIITCANKNNGPKKGEEMQEVGLIQKGFIAVNKGYIKAVGSGDGADYIMKDTTVLDAEGKLVMPGLVDPHTHLIHAGSRENELALKLRGAKYLDILKNGGGILSTVRATRAASKEELISKASKSLDIMLSTGTTTIEAKSGYGLNFEDEVKCLEVIKELNHPIDVVPTFMGAHAIPEEYRKNSQLYIEEMINQLIPYVSEKKLCEYIDCFCEEGVFSLEDSGRILQCGQQYGLKVKIHADEIEPMGGAQLAAKLGAVSAEHLVAASDEGFLALKDAGTIAVLLPGTSFYLRMNKYARGKEMIDVGIPIAIATDYNPGSSPTESLQGIFVFACMGMGLTPEQIINAATINAAYAIGRGQTVGSLEPGKKGDILIMDAPNEHYIVYHYGINHVEVVVKNGQIVVDRRKKG